MTQVASTLLSALSGFLPPTEATPDAYSTTPMLPEGNDVEIFELVGLQPTLAHVTEQHVKVTKCPVGVLPYVLAE